MSKPSSAETKKKSPADKFDKRKESDFGAKDIELGGVVYEPGNAARYKTGDWRSQRPVWNKERCIKCAMCSMFCPEGCIGPDSEGYYEADLYYCKGCGICARECWTQAITMVEEEE